MAFTTFKTSDGRWEYGTGKYEKKISDYLGVNAPSASTFLPDSLVDFFFPQKKALQTMSYGVASAIKIPTFYIWRKPVGELKFIKKRIAEWPFAKSQRDAAFPGFRTIMDDRSSNDLQRAAFLQKMQASAGAPSLNNLARLFALEQQNLVYSDIDKRVRYEAGGTFLVLAVAAALGLFIVFQ